MPIIGLRAPAKPSDGQKSVAATPEMRKIQFLSIFVSRKGTKEKNVHTMKIIADSAIPFLKGVL